MENGRATAARRRGRTWGTVRARRNPDICQTVKGVFVLAKILSVVPLELRPLGLRIGWIGHVLKADRI